MKTAIILLIIIFTSGSSYSQLIENWTKRYNGNGNSIDIAIAMGIDASRNIYITGNSYSSATANDYATIKYDQSGIQEWVMTYNGTGNGFDNVTGMLVVNSDIYVSGFSQGAGSAYDYLTVKYNASGVQQWAARYVGFGNDGAYGIAVDTDGNIYITGESYSGPGASYDYLTVKYNPMGVQQWEQRYNGTGSGNDAAYAITTDVSNNVYITGKSTGSGTSLDYATVKYNSAGQQQWVASYNGTANYIDAGTAISVNNSGQVSVSGYSSGTNTGYDITTVSYDAATGNELWVSKFNGTVSGNDMPSSLKTDLSGFIYLTGVTNFNAGGLLSDYVTLKYNSSGILQWTAIYNGTGNANDSATSLAVDLSGNVFVTGKSKGVGTSFDYLTIQYNSSGIPQHSSRNNSAGSFNDVANALKLDVEGNIYVAGSSFGAASDEDYLTVKYSKILAINTLSSEIPDKFELSQNYPNPFNPSTNIVYSITSKGIAKLRIVNIEGNEIETLVNEFQNPGTYSVQWDAKHNPSGIYYYTLDAEGFSSTKKMILIR